MILILFSMLLIGSFQIMIALNGLLLSKDDRKKKHYAFYFIGVGIYFFVIPLLLLIYKLGELPVCFPFLFLGGALFLMLYNLAIVMEAFSERQPETSEAHAG